MRLRLVSQLDNIFTTLRIIIPKIPCSRLNSKLAFSLYQFISYLLQSSFLFEQYFIPLLSFLSSPIIIALFLHISSFLYELSHAQSLWIAVPIHSDPSSLCTPLSSFLSTPITIALFLHISQRIAVPIHLDLSSMCTLRFHHFYLHRS